MSQVPESKPYCQICGKELTEAAPTCSVCGDRVFRMRKDVEPEFTAADDEPIPFTVTEKGWQAG